MKNAIAKYYAILEKLKDLPPLIFRLVIAYGFYGPAMKKVGNFEGTAKFFAKLDIPLPTFNAYLAGITEFLGVWLLLLGLGTRLIAIPLMVTMAVAIYTVHYKFGFKAVDNGYQIQLYFIFMLFLLLIFGSGRISLDHLIGRWRKNRE